MQIKLIKLLMRIFFITRHNKLLMVMTLLASLTTIIATIACCLTIAIQNSFHKLLRDQLTASCADIIITPKSGHHFLKKHANYFNSLHHISAWAPACWKYGLVAHDNPVFSDAETL